MKTKTRSLSENPSLKPESEQFDRLAKRPKQAMLVLSSIQADAARRSKGRSKLDWVLRQAPSVLLTLLVAMGPLNATGLDAKLESLQGEPIRISDMEKSIVEIMEKGAVPGLSCAIINDAEIVYCKAFGLQDQKTGALNNLDTLFAGASFSKTVFAYLVMLLTEEDVIDLNRPLYQYLDKPICAYKKYSDLEGDDRHRRITARMCLSHSTGFPNWRFLTADKKLTFLFDPGARFYYSGEGIQLLQMVVEEVTGKGLEELARAKVFAPLGMTRTSYVWQGVWVQNVATPHDRYERPKRLMQRHQADAAGSLFTTAHDYARLLAAIINAKGKCDASMKEMLHSQIGIGCRNMFGPGAWQETDAYKSIHLSWGLGWGRFDTPYGPAFFHTGHDFGWQNYTVAHTNRGLGVVLLSNSDNFESVARELVQATIGDTVSPLDWLGYPHYDPNQKRQPPPGPKAIDVDPSILKAYAGRYEFVMMDSPTVVKFEQAQLLVSNDGSQWMPLLAQSETRFFVDAADYRFMFIKDEQGNVTHMKIEIAGIEVLGQKID